MPAPAARPGVGCGWLGRADVPRPRPSPRRADLNRPGIKSQSLVSGFLLWYSSSMPLVKRKISISLDEDLVAELESRSQSLSAQVNAAIRADVERQRRRRLLGELLDELDAAHGPVDEALVEKYVRILE